MRTVNIWGLYRTDTDGTHFAIVRTGTWRAVVAYLNATARYTGPRQLFVEGRDGKLRPLMA